MKYGRSLPGILVVIFSCTVITLTQQPQQKIQLEDPDWVKEIAPNRVVYAVPGMKQVKVRKNVTYKHVPGAELKMDIYSPPRHKSSARRAAVIFIHGGRIPSNLLTTPKDWGAFISYGQLVAASGYVGVTFNHRFYTWNSLNDSQADVSDLIAYVRNNAESLGVDKDRIILWAVSAGGIFLSQTLREPPQYIRALIGFYAELDLQNLRKVAPASVTDETLREFSPVYHLSKSKKGIPPLLIARAGLDDRDLNDGLDRFVQAALSNNLSIELINHAEGHHGFDVDDNNERSREIIRRALEFIKAHS